MTKYIKTLALVSCLLVGSTINAGPVAGVIAYWTALAISKVLLITIHTEMPASIASEQFAEIAKKTAEHIPFLP